VCLIKPGAKENVFFLKLALNNSRWKVVTFRRILSLNLREEKKKYINPTTTLKNEFLSKKKEEKKKNFESHSSHLIFALLGDIYAA